MITIQVDTKATTRYLDDVQKRQIPFAASVALNKTARLAEAGIKSEMRRLLDRPKPYTLGGTFVSNSTKSKLTAIVGLKDKASSGRAAGKYLLPLVAGSQRRQAGWERALQAMGAIPSGMRAVPAGGAKIDRYGNLDKKQLTEMMGALRSRMRTFKGKGKRAHADGYFVALPGTHLTPGIYYRIERTGESAIKPVVIFVSRAQYKPTLKVEPTVRRVVDASFAREFGAALSTALASAR
ncbi:MAG: hypothetical protein M0P19_08905 [Nevskia sp.]|jgi:hypothetical protein|nr:hypothetical protein [Nevskia sp.]MCK9386096.1 hypothetical protein [Nevskia sp.]MCK9386149.1 hypothetical protein [Nevskia sp.]